MILRIYSDLHLEYNTNGYFSIEQLEGEKEQILILAGDIDMLKNLSKENGLNFISELCSRFKHVFYVFGNHEYYLWKIGGKYNKDNIKIFEKFSNLSVLSRELPSVIIEDYCFIGATLWSQLSEYDQLDPRGENSSNDAKYIKQVSNNRFSSLKKQFVNKENSLDFLWIKNECEKYKDHKKVIITHYPPIRVLEPNDPHGYEKNFYSNDLKDQISKFENINLWVFGHVHFNNIFNQTEFGIPFFSNPIGDKKTDKPKDSVVIL